MLFQNVLSLYRIQRVPKLMGNTSINYIQKLILSSLLVKHDGVRNIHDLSYGLTFQNDAFYLHVSILILASSKFINFEYHVFNFCILTDKKVIQAKFFSFLSLVCLFFIVFLKLELILLKNRKIKKLVLLNHAFLFVIFFVLTKIEDM